MGFNSGFKGLIIITIRHQLHLDSPVSISSNCRFKGVPSRLHPSGLQFSIILVTLLLFILVTFCSEFDLYLLSFSSTGTTFKSLQHFSISFRVKSVCCTINSIEYSMLLLQSKQSVKSVVKSRVVGFFFTGYRYFSLQYYTQTKSGAQFLSWVLSLGRKHFKLQHKMYLNGRMNSELSSAHHKKKK